MVKVCQKRHTNIQQLYSTRGDKMYSTTVKTAHDKQKFSAALPFCLHQMHVGQSSVYWVPRLPVRMRSRYCDLHLCKNCQIGTETITNLNVISQFLSTAVFFIFHFRYYTFSNFCFSQSLNFKHFSVIAILFSTMDSLFSRISTFPLLFFQRENWIYLGVKLHSKSISAKPYVDLEYLHLFFVVFVYTTFNSAHTKKTIKSM